MKRIRTTLLLPLAAAALLTSACSGDVPQYTNSDVDKLKGKVVLLNFWATWCGPCRAEIPDFIRLYDQYKGQGLVIVGASVDQKGPSVVREFREQNGMNYPVAMAANELIERYGPIRGIPKTILLDREGRIVQTYDGMRSGDVFESDIKKLL